eukprot:132460-Hanusia_phi.AAC.1
MSPASPQTDIQTSVSCSLCVADLPDWAVFPFPSTSALSFKDLPPPVCGGSKFGPNCAYTCQGIVVGDKCVCPTGSFGFLCDQQATVNTQLSPPPKQVDPNAETQITSAAGIGVSFPPGAITTPGLVVSVKVFEFSGSLDLGPQQAVITPAGPVVVFEPSGVFFETDVEIFTPFDPSQIPAG